MKTFALAIALVVLWPAAPAVAGLTGVVVAGAVFDAVLRA